MQPIAELERDVGPDLVGAIGERRDEQQLRLGGREEITVGKVHLRGGIRQRLEHRPQPLMQRQQRFRRQGVLAVPGDPDGKDERQHRRAAWR